MKQQLEPDSNRAKIEKAKQWDPRRLSEQQHGYLIARVHDLTRIIHQAGSYVA